LIGYAAFDQRVYGTSIHGIVGNFHVSKGRVYKIDRENLIHPQKRCSDCGVKWCKWFIWWLAVSEA